MSEPIVTIPNVGGDGHTAHLYRRDWGYELLLFRGGDGKPLDVGRSPYIDGSEILCPKGDDRAATLATIRHLDLDRDHHPINVFRGGRREQYDAGWLLDQWTPPDDRDLNERIIP